MRVEQWTTENVREDGAIIMPDGVPYGYVQTKPSISMSSDNGGCELEKCKCSKGHWLTVTFERDNEKGSVSGVTVWFDNFGELAIFLSLRQLS